LLGLLFSGLCRGRLDCWVADVSLAMLLSSSELVNKLVLTSVADVVASVTLNYQLVQNSLEFETLIFLFKKLKKGANSKKQHKKHVL
jgi:hypothetical protein